MFLVNPSSTNSGCCGSLCVQEGYETAGAFNRWRASYGTGYGFGDVATVSFEPNAITITSISYPFAKNKVYQWMAY